MADYDGRRNVLSVSEPNKIFSLWSVFSNDIAVTKSGSTKQQLPLYSCVYSFTVLEASFINFIQLYCSIAKCHVVAITSLSIRTSLQCSFYFLWHQSAYYWNILSRMPLQQLIRVYAALHTTLLDKTKAPISSFAVSVLITESLKQTDINNEKNKKIIDTCKQIENKNNRIFQ